MIELHQSQFDIYALSLPAGLAFGNNAPRRGWRSKDGATVGVLTTDDDDKTCGILIMRRREDDVWTVTRRERGIRSEADALTLLESCVITDLPREKVPPGTPRRPPLWDLKDVTPSNVFASLTRPTHHVAAWLLNQLYLALPRPDPNWARDCQAANFHTRLWEAHLLACFREQGLRVSQDFPAPDFHIANRDGGEAWVEAVTANPPLPYDHFNATPEPEPESREERLLGPAAIRFAKTIRSKLAKHYEQLPHVAGKPFAIAIADFHAPGSMIWSRAALPSYLYGLEARLSDDDAGTKTAMLREARSLLGAPIPAGLFRKDDHSELSAVIFSNACSIAKLNRVGISAGADPKTFRYVRFGEFFDRTPGALEPIHFVFDVRSKEYRALWEPYNYEPWSAELEVFHNPFARFPISNELLPEATHWRMIDGEVSCTSFYPWSILRSRTLILPGDKPVPTIEELFEARDQPEE